MYLLWRRYQLRFDVKSRDYKKRFFWCLNSHHTSRFTRKQRSCRRLLKLVLVRCCYFELLNLCLTLVNNQQRKVEKEKINRENSMKKIQTLFLKYVYTDFCLFSSVLNFQRIRRDSLGVTNDLIFSKKNCEKSLEYTLINNLVVSMISSSGFGVNQFMC